MPIVHFINSKQKQTAGGMKCVLGYVSKEKKTVKEDRKFVTGINCDPAHAYDEMMLTKKVYNKTDGRQYYHLVQSFPKGYDITPEKAHQIALEFAKRAFGQYECVVATHIDREHIHSHIVFNSVSFDTGKKYHSDKENPLKLMNLSDEICREFNKPTLADPEPRLKQQALAAGGSAPNHAHSDHRADVVSGGRTAAESHRVTGYDEENAVEEYDRSADAESPRSADGDSSAGAERLRGNTGTDQNRHITGDDGLVITGWEPERSVLLNAEAARRMLTERQAQVYENSHCVTIGALDIISGVTYLASLIDGAPSDPEELEKYLEDIRAAQNAGFIIGFAVEAIKILSERLEEMKAGQLESEDEAMEVSEINEREEMIM